MRRGWGIGAAVGLLLAGSGAAHAQLTTFVIEFGNTGANTARDGTFSSFDVLGSSTTLTQVWNPFTAGPDAPATGNTGNGMAADVINNRVFWRASTSGTAGDGSLYVWDRNNNTQRLVTGANGATFLGNASNAAFYNGAYWYVPQGLDTLVRLKLDFSNPNAPTFTRRTFANFDNDSAITSFNFGDIVISASGVLYGSASERFFRADLSSITDTTGGVTGYQTLSSSSGRNLQMVLSQDEQTLYGARNDSATNSVTLYQVRQSDGAETALKTFSGVRFTDLTGVYPTGILAAPEPGSIGLVFVGGIGLCAIAARRKPAKSVK